MYCLETRELAHRFSNREFAVNNISLQVPEGCIYGFLGPNGAGKTTTLRLVLGLLRKQQGEIFFYGKSFEQHRVDLLKKTGSLIESPSLYSHLTAVENLRVLQKVYQCPAGRIREVLDLVGLSRTGSKKAGQFSLGMKQRLSIAVAMLHNPSFLILDEPTNGLDPNGMIEIRELLKKLNGEAGITILVSSHILSEIEKFVSHVGIIHNGKMMFQGTLDELKSKQHGSSGIILETSDNEKAFLLLKGRYPAMHIENGWIIIPEIARKEIAHSNRELVNENIEVYAIRSIKNDLESIFMNLIND